MHTALFVGRTDEILALSARKLCVAGLVALVGRTPHTQRLAGTIEMDANGVLRLGHPPIGQRLEHELFLETSMPGVFAVGDAHCRPVKHVASAAEKAPLRPSLSTSTCAQHDRRPLMLFGTRRDIWGCDVATAVELDHWGREENWNLVVLEKEATSEASVN